MPANYMQLMISANYLRLLVARNIFSYCIIHLSGNQFFKLKHNLYFGTDLNYLLFSLSSNGIADNVNMTGHNLKGKKSTLNPVNNDSTAIEISMIKDNK